MFGGFSPGLDKATFWKMSDIWLVFVNLSCPGCAEAQETAATASQAAEGAAVAAELTNIQELAEGMQGINVDT